MIFHTFYLISDRKKKGIENFIHVRYTIDFFNFFETKYGPFAKVIILSRKICPAFLGVFFFCPETAVEGIEPLWIKLENSICKLIHGVKCYVFFLEHIIDWHLDVVTIVLYLFFKSQLLQLVRQTNIRLMVLFGQLHSLAKPPGPLPCTRIKEHQSPDLIICHFLALPGHGSQHQPTQCKSSIWRKQHHQEQSEGGHCY